MSCEWLSYSLKFSHAEGVTLCCKSGLNSDTCMWVNSCINYKIEIKYVYKLIYHEVHKIIIVHGQ